MTADTLRMRLTRLLFTNLKSGEGVDSIIDFIIDQGGVKQNSRIARSSLRLIRFGFEDSSVTLNSSA
jgi:hypothetical protein